TQKKPFLTAYGLLAIALIVAYFTTKGVQIAQGTFAPLTALEWVSGALAIALYMVGMWEGVRPRVAVWFFHRDYKREVGVVVVRFFGAACRILAQGLLVPIIMFVPTFVPLWISFNPAAEDPTSTTYPSVPRAFAFVISWTAINIASRAFAEYILDKYNLKPQVKVARPDAHADAFHIKLQADSLAAPATGDGHLPQLSAILHHNPTSLLITAADVLATLAMLSLTTFALHTLWLRFPTFWVLETVGGVALGILLGVLKVIWDYDNEKVTGERWLLAVLLVHGAWVDVRWLAGWA
ncbi:hypothetical protein EUX98_g7912, partial [Antrodiella citrinella]